MGDSASNWIDFNQKNKPQSNALAGGIMVLLVSGMQIGWIFNGDLMHFPWARGHTNVEIIFTYASFYVAAIVGLYLATLVIDRLTKKNIYVSCIKKYNSTFLSNIFFSSPL